MSWTSNDLLTFGGSSVAAVASIVAQADPTAVMIGVAAVITATGGLVIKAMEWYSRHTHMGEQLNVSMTEQRRLKERVAELESLVAASAGELAAERSWRRKLIRVCANSEACPVAKISEHEEESTL